jgi:hypothetical protein
MEMKLLAVRHLMLRHATALAPLIASLASTGQSEAACTPASPVSNVTVTCTGATNNANGINGYGSASDTGNTYDISHGASITGANIGLLFGTGTVLNSVGDIRGATAGISATSGTVISSGTIQGTSPTGIGVDMGSGAVGNSGLIVGVNQGIRLQNGEVTNAIGGIINAGIDGVNIVDQAKVSNSGTISGGQRGISIGAPLTTVSAEISNSGNIRGGISGIESLKTLNVINSGRITGDGDNGFGISSSADLTLRNSGGGVVEALGASGKAIAVESSATVVNAGFMSADRIGIDTNTGSVDNSGRILAMGANGIAIRATDRVDVINRADATISGLLRGIASINVNLANAGTISTGANGVAVFGTTVNVNANTGIISGGANGGVRAIFANVANSGLISGADGIIATTANVANAGTISGDATGAGIVANVASVTNSGTISGKVGINILDPIKGSTIDNSGTIVGTGGTAIKLTSAADTLTLRAGSRIIGVVDMGFGDDVVNIFGTAPTTRVSSLTTISVPTFINFTGVLNTTFSGGNNANPAVQVGNQLATLDPTALALADRALMDFTGGVSSLVQGAASMACRRRRTDR